MTNTDLHLGDYLDVIERFQSIKDVLWIELTLSGRAVKFCVFVAGAHYDDVLMTKLLDLEWEIHHQYPERQFLFDYLPGITA